MIVKRHMTRRWCMEHSNVRLVSTTEDPVDDLHCHIALQKEKMFTRVITAFRPDKAMFIEQDGFSDYLDQLQGVSGIGIVSFETMLDALEARLKFFQEQPAPRSVMTGSHILHGLIIRIRRLPGYLKRQGRMNLCHPMRLTSTRARSFMRWGAGTAGTIM